MNARERARRRFEAWLTGRNQDEVARALRVQQATVSRYASGGFSLARLDDIARVMGTTPEALVASRASASATDLIDPGVVVVHDSQDADLVLLFRELSAVQRTLVSAIVRDLLRASEETSGKPHRRTAT